MKDGAVLDVKDLRFAWPGGPQILAIDHFQIAQGERVFLRGPSGSGKSTLLGLIAGLMPQADGHIRVFDTALEKLSPAGRDQHRAAHIGVIFQMFNLLPFLSVLENTLLPLQVSPTRRARLDGSAKDVAAQLLSRLGLSPELFHRQASDLSVGQQQRVAAARALIGRPALIIADEPTSALDQDARRRFITLLNEETTESGAALLFVSHDENLASHFDRAVSMAALNASHMTTESMEGA